MTEAVITADGPFDRDAVLAGDVAFHLGSRDGYEPERMASLTAAIAPPDDVFVCFRISPPEIFAGEFYKRHCTITAKGFEGEVPRSGGKHKRTVAVLNRDFPMMAEGVPYAFNLRDARRDDYARHYGTAKPIPVFQHCRREGMHAIVHPLAAFHTFPSKNIPAIEDTLAFRDKKRRIFWRGKLSGRIETADGVTGFGRVLANDALSEAEKRTLMRQLGRVVICEAFLGSDIVDARLVQHNEGKPTPVPAFIEAAYGRRILIEEYLGNRYLLALDGNDGPSSWYWMLNTNSLVFRQASPWETFADNYFRPWIHFVPFAADGGDLIEKFEWCETHTGQCERMIANARKAWSILFDKRYQRERRAAVMTEYNGWFA